MKAFKALLLFRKGLVNFIKNGSRVLKNMQQNFKELKEF